MVMAVNTWVGPQQLLDMFLARKLDIKSDVDLAP